VRKREESISGEKLIEVEGWGYHLKRDCFTVGVLSPKKTCSSWGGADKGGKGVDNLNMDGKILLLLLTNWEWS